MSKKRMRLPNGFGQITEIKNAKLRKPICKLLKPESYFKTYNEAYSALLEYNKNPYDFDSLITVEELYNKWSEEHYKKLQKSSSSTLKTAWKYCHKIYKLKVREIRTRHLKECINDSYIIVNDTKKYSTATTKQRIKSILNNMFDYAVEYELADKNYARLFNLPEDVYKEFITPKNNHLSFTDEEIELLWSNVDSVPFVDIILIQCYSGWRPSEIGQIKRLDCDMENGIMIGGIKTSNGKNRVVPIHPRIKKLVDRYYNESVKLNSEWLFNSININCYKKDGFLSYERFKKAFNLVVESLQWLKNTTLLNAYKIYKIYDIYTLIVY